MPLIWHSDPASPHEAVLFSNRTRISPSQVYYTSNFNSHAQPRKTRTEPNKASLHSSTLQPSIMKIADGVANCRRLWRRGARSLAIIQSCGARSACELDCCRRCFQLGMQEGTNTIHGPGLAMSQYPYAYNATEVAARLLFQPLPYPASLARPSFVSASTAT